MATKAELSTQIEHLEHEVRRLKRSVSHMSLDCSPEPARGYYERAVYPSEHARRAIERAEAEWELDVTEPEYEGYYERINVYIKGRDGLSWSWEKDYTRNGQFSWCGAFVAFCYGSALRADIRKKIMPSCYRLMNNWGRTSRLRDGEEPMPGDIVVVFTDDTHSPSQGNHITLCVGAPDELGNFPTIEGNAHGMSPHGPTEGVIKRERALDSVAHIYRLLPEDFEER
jgi:hypothetical protein